ncbi:MAG: hypothetical protein H0W86_08420, partial [Armatimonadetes bacterium]|nr:hypothetical protein [Armatimonadota bacterium]
MRLWLTTCLVLLGHACFGDGLGHAVVTPDWTIETSEDLANGTRGKGSYPVWQLVDRDPRTAWVYRANDYPKPKNEHRQNFAGNYWIKFEPSGSVWLDELRIRPGYQKTPSLWRKNSRPTQIQVFDRLPMEWNDAVKGWFLGKPMRTVDLADSMDEKSVRLPKRKYAELYVVFSKIERGAVDDLCISEMMPRAGGKDVIQPLTSFMYSIGSDCGCSGAFWLTKPNGQKVATADYEYPRFSFSPDGRYVAGITDADNRPPRVWVAELARGKVVWSGRIPSNERPEELIWT